MKKRLLSLLLAAALIFSFAALPAAAEEETDPFSGACGTDVSWALDADCGVLTISGEGYMAGYSPEKPAPWNGYADIITSVVVETGVTSIGNCAFQDLYELTEVSLPYGLTNVGRSAFSGCESLEELVIPSTVMVLGFGSLDISPDATVAVLGMTVTDQTEGITVGALYGIPGCGLQTEFLWLNEGVQTVNGCFMQNVYAASNEVGVSFAETVEVNHLGYVPGEPVAPDCAHEGYTVYTCTGCGDSYRDDFTPADPENHVYGEGVHIEPTCAEDGFGCTRYTCEYCGATYDTDLVDPHYYPLDVTGLESDHSYHDDRVEEWTVSCTEEDATGLRLVFAPECELELEYDFLNIYDGNGALLGRYTGTQLASLTVDILTTTATLRLETERSNATYGFRVAAAYGTAHVWDEGEVTTAPGVEAGEMTYTCTRCGAKRTEALDKTLLDGGTYSYGSYELTWELTLDYELILYGEGVTCPSVGKDAAWGKYRDLIRSVRLENFSDVNDNAFSSYGNLTSVILPEGLTAIRSNAFSNCSALNTVILPTTLTEIGNSAFCYCKALTSLDCPDSLRNIGSYAFEYSGLRDISLPNIVSIRNGAFSETSIQNVTLPSSLKYMGSVVFTSLEELTLTSREIQFYGRPVDKLERVNLAFPDADDWYDIWLSYSYYTHPLDDSFSSATPGWGGADLYFNGEKITEVKIPGTYTEIPAYAFRNVDSIETLLLPANMDKIGDCAFQDCSNLSEVVYVTPNILRSIGTAAFGDTAIPELHIPASVATLSERNIQHGRIVFEGPAPMVFSLFGANGVLAFYPSEDESWTDLVNADYGGNVIWLPVGETVVASGTEGGLSWTLDIYGVLHIEGDGPMQDYLSSSNARPGWYAYRRYISSIEIGDGVTSIGSDAFYSCSNLRSVTIPEGVTSIGSDAFYYCSNLRSVTIPASVTSLGGSAFQGCGLTSVTFLGSAPSVGIGPFSYVTATVHYPADDPTWTAEVRQRFGGTLTWTGEELEHHYVDVVTEPTCTADGYTTHTCSICGDSYVDSTVPALGHDYETRTVEPTCTEQGFTGEVCTRCGDFIPVAGSEVPALGHSYSEEVVPPTCAEDGYTRHTCDTCGDWYDDSIVPATGEHSWYQYYTSRFATCMEEGAEVWRCSVCGCTETRATPKAEHSYSEYVTAPTCTSTGYTTFICVWCGNSHVGDFTAPSGHCWDDGMTVEEASCTEIGSVLYTCGCCGAERTVIVPATGHVVVIDPAVPATWDEGGMSEGTHCDQCGEVLKAQQPTKPLSEQETVVIQSAKAALGRDVQIAVSLRNNTGIAGMRLMVEYDSSVMTLMGVTDNGLLGQHNHSDNLSADPYILLWANGEATENFAASGDIAYLTFHIAEDAAPGEYPVTVSFEAQDIIDANTAPVYFVAENGTVQITEFLYGDVNDDGSVDVVDCFFLLRYLANWKDYDAVDATIADVNLDGEVDMLDAAILLRHIAQCVGFEELPYLG